MRKEIILMSGDPQPGGGGSWKDAKKVSGRKTGDWRRPEKPEDDGSGDENRGVATAAGLSAAVLKSGFINPDGIYHDSWLTPHAPYLVPVLFGITLSQMNGLEGVKPEDKPFSGGLFALVSLYALWEGGKIFWEAGAERDVQSLTYAGLCAAAIAAGRVLNLKDSTKSS